MKKNNKGFSLVELIVVVLIMGIIAVALAPQVMKWVDKSREAKETTNMTNVEASIETAYAEYQADYGKVQVASAIELKSASWVASKLPSTASPLAGLIDEVIGGEWDKAHANDGTPFKFTIDSKGKVTVTK